MLAIRYKRFNAGNSEWKQKLENEKKQTRKLEKALRKLRADVDAVDPVTTTTKKKSQKSEPLIVGLQSKFSLCNND